MERDRRIIKENPYALHGSYVSPDNRYLKNYSPNPTAESWHDQPTFK